MNGPRRTRSCWLEGAPNYVIDCIRCPQANTWVVLLGVSYSDPEHYNRTGLLPCLEFNDYPTSPNMGISMFGECHKDWRRESKGRVRWLDIPVHLRDHVIRRCS